ncbi:uncharacterized protein A1O9_08218 [Exophiala aquamarina CBS 119918]|uniref:Heterokaryon incompatibility domain-containing protein n=1 Tax=Exophiala aquamarina CBS 119918 TaxID=1182545 RepID=A0A072P853_9EURO|nr:uncharacterized protein A1O9_08218 [Exophiala aquamarina CBS 119918]KEF55468.1 hypothetical protein A1O9_08218 [Exophiala aquamarina CBS 119918]
MRLLNVDTLKLESYHHAETTPPYAILSHVWEEEEVTFQDIDEPFLGQDFRKLQARFDELEKKFNDIRQLVADSTSQVSSIASDQSVASPVESVSHQSHKAPALPTRNSSLDRAKRLKGWSKVEGCCQEAVRFGLHYVWIDTCCIDKSNSSELSEAINSMFAWYRDAELCLAYLSDSSTVKDAFDTSQPSKWFSRGWTLQELVAPSKMIFFNRDWVPLGTRSYLDYRIEQITSIPVVVLKNGIAGEYDEEFSIATKMSWAAQRKTTRSEDRAYSLMGLFQVNMPTLYGEGGQSAFQRLQGEIFAASGDHSILAWCSDQFRVLTRLQINDAMFNGASLRKTTKLLAPGVESFSPSPRYQDLPVNLVNRFGIASTDTAIPFYPILLPCPYDLRTPNLKNSSSANGAKYSESSHGMRVQLLLERVWADVRTDRHIFIAHLACRIQPSEQIAGILLISERIGQYQRLFPDVLLSIDPKYHNMSRLMLEDVYIIQKWSSRQGGLSRTLRYGTYRSHFYGKYSICILDKEVEKSGFELLQSTTCERMNIPGGKLLTFGSIDQRSGQSFGNLKASDYAELLSFPWGTIDFREANILLFGRRWDDKSAHLIAVVWLRHEDSLKISVLADVDPARPIPDDISFASYDIYETFISHWAEKAGDTGGINIVFQEDNIEPPLYRGSFREREKKMHVVIL